MRSLLEAMLKRPLGMLAACLFLSAAGITACWGLKVNLFPSRPYPVITVTTMLPRTGPQEVETQITRPMEEELRGVMGLRKVFSRSRTGRAEVTLELHPTTKVSDAAQQVRGRLRRLRPKLPENARPPVISLYNPSQRPVAALAVSGGESLGAAGDWARQELAPRLRRLDGVAEVIVSGAPEPEILATCDPGRLQALGLTVHQVALALSRGSQSLPGGKLHAAGRSLTLRTSGRVSTVAEVAALPVAADPNGGVVTLDQIAQVKKTYKETRELNRLAGRPVAALSLQQAWGGDMGRLWERVEKVLAEYRNHPQGYKVEVIYSRAQTLDQAMGRLGWVGLIALGAAALVLFLFLRSPGSTLVALAAIPFSLLTALFMLWLMGQRLDIIALSGLTLALGILVDNAVVVIEAVHHHLGKGLGRKEAVRTGVLEVAQPICFATLTTVAAFLPLLAVSDHFRLHLGGFFWGMSLSLLASLLAALILIPALLSLLPISQRTGAKAGSRLSAPYSRLLDFVQRRPVRTILTGLLFLALASVLAARLPLTSGSGLGVKGLMVVMVTPPGTPKENTAASLHKLESKLVAMKEVKRVHTRIWSNQGRLTVTLKEQAGQDAAVAQIRKLLPKSKRIQYHLLPMGQAAQGSGNTTLNLNIFGKDMAKLSAYAKQIRARLAKLAEVKDSILKMGSPSPQMNLYLNHRLLGSYGLSARDVADQVRAHLTGPVALRLTRELRELEVRVKAATENRAGVRNLQDIRLAAQDHRSIPLGEVVGFRMGTAPGELFREDYRRVIRLTVVMSGKDLISSADLVRKALADLPKQPGYYWSLDEEINRAAETRFDMLGGAILALLLVYLVMVAASESWAGPLVVLAVAPFAAAGAVFGLWAMGMPLSMPVFLGGVILAGMLVNTGLVMIDAMSQARDRGASPSQAARSGALRRLRPVMITTLSTIAAGAPLLLDKGAGSSSWSPLALTLTAGLIFSALFSLVLTPALYPWAARLDEKLGRKQAVINEEALSPGRQG